MTTADVGVEMFLTDGNGNVLSGEEAAERLSKLPGFEPYIVYSDCPYAAFVEFGTDKASPSDPGGRDLTDALFEWAEAKFGYRRESREAHAVVYSAFRKILDEGMPPMPFFRPAMYDVLEKYSAEGGADADVVTLREIAEEMRDRMRMYLVENGQNATGMLSESLDFKPYDDDMQFADDDIPDEAWEHPDVGKDGERRPPERWKRL